ncbi:MAG: ABC transporter permease [Chloroflexi bacterium]|nr:ABC transporter permease [Chloroflexota bacterium]
MGQPSARATLPSVHLPAASPLLRAAHLARRKPLGAAGLAAVVLWIAVALGAPLLSFGQDPLAQEYIIRLQGPSLRHWLGTDEFGRDVYARILYGARISLGISFVGVGIGSTVGLAWGLVSGLARGWLDELSMRLVDVLLAFPGLLLVMALVAVMGTGVASVVLALTILACPRMARIMRGQALAVREATYVEAARAVGASSARILLRHVLPNVVAPYLVLATALLGSFVVTEATLSFLGLGVTPPQPSWGLMLSGGAQAYAQTAPWLVLFPGLAMTSLVMGFNLFGDALRDLWDPRLRGT